MELMYKITLFTILLASIPNTRSEAVTGTISEITKEAEELVEAKTKEKDNECVKEASKTFLDVIQKISEELRSYQGKSLAESGPVITKVDAKVTTAKNDFAKTVNSC